MAAQKYMNAFHANGSQPANGVNGIHEEVPLEASPIFKGTTRFEPDPSTKNIMITGGSGFIGSWVVRHLTLTYPMYNIICFDKVDYCASLNNTKCLDSASNFTFVFGDITDEHAVLRCMRSHKIDTILHFAAMSHVDLSFGNSFAFTKANVDGTHRLLEASVKVGLKKFIHVSTDEVNGENHGEDLTEESILKPTNPYAASKAAAEMFVNAYTKSYKLPCIIVRSNNVYGPHQYPEKIIPKFSSLLTLGKPLILHGSGANTRRYLFASDAADAFDTVLHRGVIGEIYNVDSVSEISNIDLAHKMLSKFGVPDTDHASRIQYVRDRPFNDMRYAVDAKKLKTLGWQQRVGFEEGLAVTVDWYKTFGARWWGAGVESVLTPFPEVELADVKIWHEGERPRATPLLERRQERMERLQAPANAFLAAPAAPVPVLVDGPGGNVPAAAGNKRKRAREVEGKENEESDGTSTAKRVLLGQGLAGEEVVR